MVISYIKSGRVILKGRPMWHFLLENSATGNMKDRMAIDPKPRMTVAIFAMYQ